MGTKGEAVRDLLLGILALEHGSVEQADLIAAFRRWSNQRSRPLGRILVEEGVLNEEDRAMLDGMVRHHVEDRDSDLARSPAASPAPFDPADVLRRLAGPDGDGDVGLWRLRDPAGIDGSDRGPHTIGVGSLVDSGPSGGPRSSLGQSTSAGGRFQLLRRHAEGGIGMVYVAMDSELHREVAIKQIHTRHADDPTSRARFLLEAEVTGRLEHPGVVPVYGLGTNDQGRPYYAMRLVRGESLQEAIDRFHRNDARPGGDPAGHTLAMRQLLGRFIDVCNAIAYAHSRGVIHRDLKPANILLGPYGETLVVDWGLAKLVGCDDPTPHPAAETTLRPASHPGSGATVAGTAIGTPSYMSPEQAEGRPERIGPASDIYCLGATLYCLVAGRPPLDVGDVNELLRRVQRGEIPTPRQANPRVPAALEAIVVKAMARRPDDRYTSARVLAEEVERWLADEPVLARRETLLERARRWMRRRRTVVWAVAAALVASTLGLAAVLVVQTRSNAALTAANSELRLANERVRDANRELELGNARERARFDLALDAIKTFHAGVSGDLLLKERRFDGLRTKLLRGASDFYRRLEELLEGQPDDRSRAALGQAYHDIGELTAQIGSQSEALAALRRGLELRLALAARDGPGSKANRDAADSLIAIGDLREAIGEPAGALESYERALGLLQPLARPHPHDASDRPAVARCLRGIARARFHMGQAAESLASHEQALAIFRELADANPASAPFQGDLAASYRDIGALHRARGDAGRALAWYGEARAIRQWLADANPDVTRYQSDLAQSDSDLGTVLGETEHFAEALVTLERARALIQRLADANPAVAQFQGDLAQNCQNVGSVLERTGRPDEALASYERARAILEQLVEANPQHALFQSRLAMSHCSVGSARQRVGRLAEAAAEYRRAIAILERLSAVQPDGYNLYNLACARSLLAGIAARPGSGVKGQELNALGEQAVAALRRAIAAGFLDHSFMRRDRDIDFLRSRRDFQSLMMDLAFPDDPFVNAPAPAAPPR